MEKHGLSAEECNLCSAWTRNGGPKTDGEGRGRMKVTTKRSWSDMLSHRHILMLLLSGQGWEILFWFLLPVLLLVFPVFHSKTEFLALMSMRWGRRCDEQIFFPSITGCREGIEMPCGTRWKRYGGWWCWQRMDWRMGTDERHWVAESCRGCVR